MRNICTCCNEVKYTPDLIISVIMTLTLQTLVTEIFDELLQDQTVWEDFIHSLTLKMEALRHSEILMTVNPLARRNISQIFLQHCSENFEYRISYYLEMVTYCRVGEKRHVATVPLHFWIFTTRHVNNGIWYLESRQDLFFAILPRLVLARLTFCSWYIVIVWTAN
jgi:hypothetical protein